MSDIERLEEYLENCKENKIYDEFTEAIANLIKRNKKLEEKEFDYMAIYLDGIYTERSNWKRKINKKIEDFKEVRKQIIEISNQNPDLAYDLQRNDYCICMLQELMKEEQ